MRIALLAILLGAVDAAGSAQVRGAARVAGAGALRVRGFRQTLRVCNAYPFATAMDVVLGSAGRVEKLTGEEPMPYKTCRDFEPALQAGDKLQFKVGDASAGTFAISGNLPENDAVLLLVIHRHDVQTTAVSFESHVFTNHTNAQVAVIDTYKGSAPRSALQILDLSQDSEKPRSERLRYNTVVAVNPGTYKVELPGHDGHPEALGDLVALRSESYVVLRTGVEAESGPSYPEDIVVFPKSDPALLRSGALRSSPLVAMLAAAAASFLVLRQ